MPPKRTFKSTKTKPEPGPDSKFVGATPGSAMRVVAAEMREREATPKPYNIWFGQKSTR